MRLNKLTVGVFSMVLIICLGASFYIGKTHRKIEAIQRLNQARKDSIIYFQRVYPGRKVKVLTPSNDEILKLNQIYIIRWEAKGIKKVDIELEDWQRAGVGGPLSRLIAADVPAERGYFEWGISKTDVFFGLKPGEKPPKQSMRMFSGEQFVLRIWDSDDLHWNYQTDEIGSSGHFKIRK